jgi:hypothetical protein
MLKHTVNFVISSSFERVVCSRAYPERSTCSFHPARTEGFGNYETANPDYLGLKSIYYAKSLSACGADVDYGF